MIRQGWTIAISEIVDIPSHTRVVDKWWSVTTVIRSGSSKAVPPSSPFMIGIANHLSTIAVTLLMPFAIPIAISTR